MPTNQEVRKYPIPKQALFQVEMPSGAHVLSVGVHQKEPYMLVEVDPESSPVWRNFRLTGVGHMLEGEWDSCGTFRLEAKWQSIELELYSEREDTAEYVPNHSRDCQYC